jgi:hypothetical protein
MKSTSCGFIGVHLGRPSSQRQQQRWQVPSATRPTRRLAVAPCRRHAWISLCERAKSDSGLLDSCDQLKEWHTLAEASRALEHASRTFFLLLRGSHGPQRNPHSALDHFNLQFANSRGKLLGATPAKFLQTRHISGCPHDAGLPVLFLFLWPVCKYCASLLHFCRNGVFWAE